MNNTKLKCFNCFKCGTFFARKYDCIRHMWTIHKTEAAPAEFTKCIFCDLQFWQSDSLQEHIEILHLGAKKPKAAAASVQTPTKEIMTQDIAEAEAMFLATDLFTRKDSKSNVKIEHIDNVETVDNMPGSLSHDVTDRHNDDDDDDDDLMEVINEIDQGDPLAIAENADDDDADLLLIPDSDEEAGNDIKFKADQSDDDSDDASPYVHQCLVCDVQFSKKSKSMSHQLLHVGQPSVVLVRLSPKHDTEYRDYLRRHPICKPRKPKKRRTKCRVAVPNQKLIVPQLPADDAAPNIKLSDSPTESCTNNIEIIESMNTFSCSDCHVSYLHEFLLEEHQQITGHGNNAVPEPLTVSIPIDSTYPGQMSYPLPTLQLETMFRQQLQPPPEQVVDTSIPMPIRPLPPLVRTSGVIPMTQPCSDTIPSARPSTLTIRTVHPNYTMQPAQQTVSTVTMSLPPTLIIRKTTAQPPVRYPAQPPVRNPAQSPIRYPLSAPLFPSAVPRLQRITQPPAAASSAELSLVGRPAIRCVLSTKSDSVNAAPPSVDAQFRLFNGLSSNSNAPLQMRPPVPVPPQRPHNGIQIRQVFRPASAQNLPYSAPQMNVPPLTMARSSQLSYPNVHQPFQVNAIPHNVSQSTIVRSIQPPAVNINGDTFNTMIFNQPRKRGMPVIESVTGGAIFKVLQPAAAGVPNANVPGGFVTMPTAAPPVVAVSRASGAAKATRAPANDVSAGTKLVVARSIFDMMHENDGEDAEMILP